MMVQGKSYLELKEQYTNYNLQSGSSVMQEHVKRNYVFDVFC